MMELNSAWHPLSIQYYSKGKFGSLHITRKVCQVIRMSDRAAFWVGGIVASRAIFLINHGQRAGVPTKLAYGVPC
jgi:hypothetical protein